MQGRGLTVVGASAGSGKTHRLTTEIERAVSAEGERAVRPEGLVAVTYTKRAQVELESRIRQALLKSKTPERAASLPLAYVGTVHAVCFRWLKDHALDVGLSPDLAVLDDDGLLLAQVLEQTVPAEEREELDELADRLEMHIDHRESMVHWDQPVEDIITLARHGRIAASALEPMAERSWRGLIDLLPQPLVSGLALDEALDRAVRHALEFVDPTIDTTKATKDAVEKLRSFERSRRFGRPSWGAWAALAGLHAGKKSDALFAPVRQNAAAYEQHPQFHADLRQFTELVYRAAALTLDRYARRKAERGLVDYVDMIDHALSLLSDESVVEDLRQRLQLVVVDELQDSSPIQLALFLRLNEIAGRSAWVGDPKQCIFEYAGADPALMDSVIQWARRTGAVAEQLPRNYRSRRALVELCNTLFAGVFAAHGMACEDVVVEADRGFKSDVDAVPAVGVFQLETANQSENALAIAAGVSRLLAAPSETPVVDRATRQVRPLIAGDIAILVATNAEAAAIADALAQRSIRSVVARSGLMSTPEGIALAAALRYLLDPRDQHALAELEALHGFDESANGTSRSAESWLESKLSERVNGANSAAPSPWRAALDALRSRVRILAPQEIVDGAIVALDLPLLGARWPDAPIRIANIDALRRFARIYEERCKSDGEGCSLAGLLRFLSSLSNTVYRHGDARRADEQHASSDDDAVTVITYHRSKGLEWPLVIMTSLDRELRRSAFDVGLECDAVELNPEDPLAGRWIRYWPWPLGNHKGASLADKAERSEVGKRVIERAQRERARLLYVGFTRPRDHLFLAVQAKSGTFKSAWLDELQHDGARAITLPSLDAATPTLEIGTGANKLSMPARVFRLSAEEVPPAEDVRPRRWFSRPRAPIPERARYRITPSAAESTELKEPAIRSVQLLHPPLLREDRGADAARVGDAVHAFLAADRKGLTRAARLRIAERLLGGFGVGAAHSPDSLLIAADAFNTFAASQAPCARFHHEVPTFATVPSEHGDRLIDGRIDLLLETEDRLIIVDHKSFPGVGEPVWRKKAQEYAPQLASYARAVSLARPGKNLEAWLHFAIAGSVVVLDL